MPASALASGRKRLCIVMAELPFVPGAARRYGVFIWKPAMTLVLACVLVLSGGGAVMASRGALPGERLYPIKLVSENMRERLVVSAAKKFSVQAAHAERRLEETEKLIGNGALAEEDRDERVQTALHGYEDHIFSMNELAVRLSVDPPKPGNGDRALQAAERLFDRHADLVASATVAEPIVAAAMLEPLGITLDLQDEVLESMFKEREHRSRDDRETDDDSDQRQELEERHRGRSEKIQERLRTLQFELDTRNLSETR